MNNKIQGSTGSNHINGMGGDDTLMGFLGNDVLTGGDGKDVFYRISSSDGLDFITDFEKGGVGPAAIDKIDVADVLTNYQDGANIADYVRVVADGNGNTFVQIDANGAVGGHVYSTVFVIQDQVFTNVGDLVRQFHPHPRSLAAASAGGISISPAGSWRRRRCKAAAGLRTA